MKNAIVKSEPRMIDIVLPGQQMDAAGRINYFHTLSKQAGEVAVKAALYAGMALFKAKAIADKAVADYNAYCSEHPIAEVH